ncbi:hypothetical protein GCM10027514_04800 [Azotobacter armeniacus]
MSSPHLKLGGTPTAPRRFCGVAIAGEPIDEPIVGHGPFMMNSEDEIRQSIRDFRAGEFGRMNPLMPHRQADCVLI